KLQILKTMYLVDVVCCTPPYIFNKILNIFQMPLTCPPYQKALNPQGSVLEGQVWSCSDALAAEPQFMNFVLLLFLAIVKNAFPTSGTHCCITFVGLVESIVILVV
ncbi:hypothetical protein OTU49_009899, partial [Cherax quadricarinatus]